jgi:hypothetical protein
MLFAGSATYLGIRAISGGSRADAGIWRWPDLDLGKRSFAVDLPPIEIPIATPALEPDESLRLSTGAFSVPESITERAAEESSPSGESPQTEATLSPSQRGQIAAVDIQSLLAAYTPTDAPEATRNAIRGKIIQAVKRRAESGRYPLILDRSGQSLNKINVVQSAGGVADLTEEIREELRRGAGDR